MKKLIINICASNDSFGAYSNNCEGIYAVGSTIKTITTDNGPEFAAHEYITRKLGIKVYFADPYSSWQKGAIENANKRIRQYIPKGASFDLFTDNKIMSIQKKINLRPREKLNFSTPKVEFFKHIS